MRGARFVLAGSMLCMGVAGMIYEYSLAALGDTLIGSSHEQVFVIIGLMMFAMGVGAAVQRSIGPPLIDRFLMIEIGLGVLGGLSGLAVMTAFAATPAYPVVLYAAALGIGLLVGFEVPLLVRINDAHAAELKSNLGEILSMDYAGSLAGALLFAYVLLSRVELPVVALATGVGSVLIALGGLAFFWRLVRRPRVILACAVLALGGLGLAWSRAESWVVRLEQAAFEDPVVHRERSVYQHIALTRREVGGDAGPRVRLYLNGHLQFDSTDERVYHELLVHPVVLASSGPFRPAERVLVLGGGDGLAVREILKWPAVREVVVVDLDAAVTGLARRDADLVRLNGGSLLDPRVRTAAAGGVTAGGTIGVERPSKLVGQLFDAPAVGLAEVRVLNVDADAFLRGLDAGAGGLFDAAVLDFPDGRTPALAKLYSVSFYRALSERLSPGAAVSVQSSSPYHAPLVFRCVGATLEAAGFETVPYHANVPSFGDWGWHLAWRPGGLTREEVDRRLARLAEAPIETSYLTPATLSAARAFGPGWLPAGEAVRPNTKLRPVLVEYHRRSWRR